MYPDLYSNIENLVHWVRSEIIGSAIGKFGSWCQVSVKSESWVPVGVKQKTQRSPMQGHFTSDIDPLDLYRLLTPET
jgi:hypothetical protein